jgi:small subunit ribosomal protein S6
MPLYESVFIVRQDVTAAQVDALADSFAKIVDENGGNIQRREYWGLRSLSYRVKKNRKGHYVLFNLDAPPASIQEMERNMRLNEDVLRYMTIRIEKLREEPSPIMQGKGDRERERADRTGRGGPRGRDDSRFGDRDNRDRDRDRDRDGRDRDRDNKDGPSGRDSSDSDTKSED